jgi:hypothetical protein
MTCTAPFTASLKASIAGAAAAVPLLVAVTVTAADDFPGIESLMSAEEFRAAGLEGLSPAQLKALNDWLIRYTAEDAPVLESREAVREVKKDFEIVSRLSGDFSGWTGKTIFTLENGQRWQQRLEGRYSYDGPPNPEVRITRNFFGFHKMTLVDEDRGIGVTRLP